MTIGMRRFSGLFFIFFLLLVVSCSKPIDKPPVIEPEKEVFESLLHEVQQGFNIPDPIFEISDLGKNSALDYTQYGEFKNVGTPEYEYVVNNGAALKRDAGIGIYPNQDGVFKEEKYKELESRGKLEQSHWDALQSDDLQAAFYVWAKAHDRGGVKSYFTASILEKAGHILPAVKAYYSAVVHFPTHVCWSSNNTFVWYIGPAAIKNIQ